MTHEPIRSIPRVCDVAHVRGEANADGPPDVLLEIAHGATRATHFSSLRDELRGEFPADLAEFFFVNTDVGAPEVAQRAAERLVAAAPERSVLVVRCLVPRTFVDCNRVIDVDDLPHASAAFELTPGLHAYVRHADDRRLLLGRYAAYRALVARAFALVCNAGGLGVMLHSYAPRSIDVPVDDHIVERLRAEYQPGRLESWPLRAEVDLLTQSPDGELLASAALVEQVRECFAAQGYSVKTNDTYSLHPGTLAHAHAQRHPERTLCLELRRDLLAREFTPFREMTMDDAKVDRAASALAAGLLAGLNPAGGGRPQNDL